VAGIGVANERSVFLLALDLAWLLWIDDRFDLYGPVELPPLLAAVEGEPTTVEGRGFHMLRTRMAEETNDPVAFQVWLDSAVEAFHAHHENGEFARGRHSWSYAEYLDNAERSIATFHFVATVALIYGWDLPTRMASPQFRRFIRHLNLTTRIQNDLASADKERESGVRANALMICESYMSRSEAWAFIMAERLGYQRLLEQDLDLLAEDNFAVLGRIIVASTEKYYRIPRERYRLNSPSPPQ
jgi:hypothetical protein